ncbi:NAD(P)/FAD-dependent oxidoreductase [Streptomyces spirodelae]|uniref:NAD(P)/FAD-dependent oxidoreductase n=1 Tax=Streptomyces spirodelae TaxID=2812904 RepID=A0ABS3WZY0_9ACTN|nr:NAD(P)/FAD-dependent oxidoreductase [Streptomyces spirodelae]MBO8188696.1 NAD(P)/FAD-dependent oxidoreductase [Streptomyces spirodelae]
MSGSDERYDVIVVGAGCAGAPLAALLARQGYTVCLVEKARLPSGTPSTHVFQADALAFLDSLGVLEKLRTTGAPLIGRADARVGDVRWPVNWPVRPGDPGGVMSVRRFRLDPLLAEAAREAGATLLAGTAVTDLVRTADGRVAGVRVSSATGGEETRGGTGQERVLRARLVVGADGRASTVARLAGARFYHVTPSQFALFWGYFAEADIGEPTFVFHRWADRVVLGLPTDDGLYQVQVGVDPARLREFRAGLPGSLLEYARAAEPVAKALSGARLVDKPHAATHWKGYFRESSGPGWVLVGDAGHFKDPTAGRGIGDAFLQAARLAETVTGHLSTGKAETAGTELDEALRRWAAWRDAEFVEPYWFAADIGSLAPLPAVLPEVLRGMRRAGTADSLFEMVNHRAMPGDIVTGPRLLGAVGRLLARGRLGVLREVAGLAAADRRRRALARSPRYETGRPHHEAW